jgi:hypothetical protein
MGILSALLFSLTFTARAYDCLPASADDSSVEKAHIHVVRNALEAQEQFTMVYNDSRRLKNRLFWSAHDGSFVSHTTKKSQKIPDFFIKNLQAQLLQALENTYADFLYYGDMGHLHLLIPNEQKVLSLQSEELLSLFHTGELYEFKKNGSVFGELKEDPHWQWLYWHRNFLGQNKAEAPIVSVRAPANAAYNTVRSIEGYREVGSVYFSANKNGCFELKSKTVSLRFDISVVF